MEVIGIMAFTPSEGWTTEDLRKLPGDAEYTFAKAYGKENIKCIMQAFMWAVLLGCDPGMSEEWSLLTESTRASHLMRSLQTSTP